MAERTLVNIIGGFLGVGKTTAINQLLAQRPAHETWAVVVNEFGDIGLDGALIGSQRSPQDGAHRDADSTIPPGVAIHEIPGGCICCTAGFAFQDAVVRLLRRSRPDRLLIEPTGIATLRSVIDTLRQPGLAEAVELRTVITVVDPAHWASTRHRTNETYRDQIEAADVLLANRTDLSERNLTDHFLREGEELFPPKRRVAVIAHGEMNSEVLDLVGSDRDDRAADRAPVISRVEPIVPSNAGSAVDAVAIGSRRSFGHLGRTAYQTIGRTFPPETIFDELRLAEWVTRARHVPHLLRLKGVFHTTGGWIAYNATPQEQSLRAASHRRDSRVECVIGPTERDTAINDDLLSELDRDVIVAR